MLPRDAVYVDRHCSTANGTVPVNTNPSDAIAYSIPAAVAATGNAVSRTRMFALIKAGEIDARRVGRRTVIMADSLRAYLDRAPPARSAT